MSKYRDNLPQLSETPFLTDGGIETTLIFKQDLELPEFAAFPLLLNEAHRKELLKYYRPYLQLAKDKQLGFILESPTWRASRDWGEKLGYNPGELEQINRKAIDFLSNLRDKYEDEKTPMPISGCIGPRGDGYCIHSKMSSDEARSYHLEQIQTFAETEADFVSAFTINYVEEAIGVSLAARECQIPSVIAFTVETDGRLPSGQPLQSAIEEVDAVTMKGPAYYMINCAHPSHFSNILKGDDEWLHRIRAVRANASCKSHAELDEAEELDRGNPEELANDHKNLAELLPNLKIVGGCCGTDSEHVGAICSAMFEDDHAHV